MKEFPYCGCRLCDQLLAVERARRSRHNGHFQNNQHDTDQMIVAPRKMSLPVQQTTQTRNPFPELSSPPCQRSGGSPTKSCYIALDTSTHSTPSSSPPNSHCFSSFMDHVTRTGSGYDLQAGCHHDSRSPLMTRSVSGFDMMTSPLASPLMHENDAFVCGSEVSIIMEETDDSQSVHDKLLFYMDEDSYRPLVVDSSMQASDVCQCLVEKNCARDDINWAIIEQNIQLNQERLVEDHEVIHNIQRLWSDPGQYRLSFRKDFRKFEVFRHPANFIPVDMVDPSQLRDCDIGDLMPAEDCYNHILLQHLFNVLKLPDIHGYCLLKDNKRSWKKVYCVLKSTGLYYSNKSSNKDNKHLAQLSSLADVNIYSILSPEKSVSAPHPHCICLKRPQVTEQKDMIYLCVEEERDFICWYTTLRLVKYGSCLRDNYKTAVNNLEKAVMKDIAGLGHGTEDSSERVAMDFSGPSGRVVDDPSEALAAACEEASRWRKKITARKVTHQDGESARSSFLTNNNQISEQQIKGLGAGVHMAQPWFHSGISRQEAIDLITKHGLVDGVFLVRESHSISGIYVLSLAHNHKVKHCQIHKYESEGLMFYSLDAGHTKFTDLIQLVEFYQLNAAGLPTCLTHYVTRLL